MLSHDLGGANGRIISVEKFVIFFFLFFDCNSRQLSRIACMRDAAGGLSIWIPSCAFHFPVTSCLSRGIVMYTMKNVFLCSVWTLISITSANCRYMSLFLVQIHTPRFLWSILTEMCTLKAEKTSATHSRKKWTAFLCYFFLHIFPADTFYSCFQFFPLCSGKKKKITLKTNKNKIFTPSDAILLPILGDNLMTG